MNEIMNMEKYKTLKLESRKIQIVLNGNILDLTLRNLSTDPEDKTLRLYTPSDIECLVISLMKVDQKTNWKDVFSSFDSIRAFLVTFQGDEMILDDGFFKIIVGKRYIYPWEYLLIHTVGMVFGEHNLEYIHGYEPGKIPGTETKGAYTIEKLTTFLRSFASQRIGERIGKFFELTAPICSLRYLPPGISACSLTEGKNPTPVYTQRNAHLEGELVHATANLRYTDGTKEIFELKNNADICRFLGKWYGVPYYTYDEWVQRKSEEEKIKLDREEIDRRGKAAEARRNAQLEEQRSKLEEELKLKAEESNRKQEEEAERERLDPLLGVESVRTAILDFFGQVKSTYPKFNTSMLSVSRDSYFGSELHMECSISLSIDGVFSPLYPDATEVYITNRWIFPEVNNDAPSPYPAECVLKPQKINILPQARVSSLDRISHLLQCLRYLFPVNMDLLPIISQVKEREAAKIKLEDDIAIRRADDKQRIQQMIEARTQEVITGLIAEFNQMQVDICTPTGTNERTSVAAACNSLQLNIQNEISDSTRNSRFSLQSSLGKSDTFQILSTVDRFFQLAL